MKAALSCNTEAPSQKQRPGRAGLLNWLLNVKIDGAEMLCKRK